MGHYALEFQDAGEKTPSSQDDLFTHSESTSTLDVEETPASEITEDATNSSIFNILVDQDTTSSKIIPFDNEVYRLYHTYNQLRQGILSHNDFIVAVDAIKWDSKPPYMLKLSINMVLSIDALQLARRLAQIGVQKYENDKELARIARIIAPPKVLRVDLSPNPSTAKNTQWFQEHAHEYRGLWVAVRAGKFMDSDKDRRALMARLQITPDDNMLVTRIP